MGDSILDGDVESRRPAAMAHLGLDYKSAAIRNNGRIRRDERTSRSTALLGLQPTPSLDGPSVVVLGYALDKRSRS